MNPAEVFLLFAGTSIAGAGFMIWAAAAHRWVMDRRARRRRSRHAK